MHEFMENIDEIEDGLFLSSRAVAMSEDILTAKGITHILTIDSWPLRPQRFIQPERYVFRFICKNDEENVDLISHFEECNQFIRSGEKVLVHCFVGVSRSATIVLAYLMNKHRISYEDALARVRARRNVAPNDGFVHQLKLYEQMNFVLNSEFVSYRLLYLTSITSQVESYVGVSHLPSEDQLKLDSILAVSGDLDVLCRHCRHPLASSKYILPHEYREDVTWSSILVDAKTKIDDPRKQDCSEEFLVPSEKIMAQCPGVAGKIYCPKCANKIGRFAWLGVYCDCGSKMQPGFVLSISKIDRNLPESSLQVTDYKETRGPPHNLEIGEGPSVDDTKEMI